MLNKINFSTENAWWLSVIYLIISSVSVLLIPKHNLRKFLETPYVKFYGLFGKILYFVLLILPVLMPFSEFNVLKYSGFAVFIFGILVYMSGIFFFSISEYHKPAMQGIYKLIKHPVYIGFFIILASISLATGSGIYFALSLLYMFNNRFLMLAEEKSCKNQYGDLYM